MGTAVPGGPRLHGLSLQAPVEVTEKAPLLVWMGEEMSKHLQTPQTLL